MKKRPVRFYLELVGLVILVIGLWLQRAFLSDALETMKTASIPLIVACFVLQWIVLFWSGMGYYVLAKHRIKLYEMCLTNLAAAGPGRVVPAGAGQLSFGTLFLKKNRFSTTHALAIALTNNMMGFIVNMVIVTGILLFVTHPTMPNNASSRYALLIVLLALAIALSTEKLRKKVRELFHTMLKTLSNPLRTLQLVMTSFAVLITNSIILALAASSVGLHISVAQAILIMSSGVALGSILPTPGGIGGVEAGIIAAFVALGYDATLATSATVIFRLATYVQPLLPGVGAYVYLRKRNKI